MPAGRCGGPYGYAHLLDVLADPEHDEHEEVLAWVGDDVDPCGFDAKQVDRLVSLVMA